VDRDQLLTNISIYWFTSSGASSANSTYEGMQAWRQMAASQPQAAEPDAAQPTGPPKGVAVFAADTTIKSVMDPHDAIEHWSEFERGGHFPAMETPDLLTNDLRDFFGKHR
jgi:hypothetical protein